MIPLQGHFFLEADKLISLFHVGSSLKARQFRKQTPSLFPLFPPLTLSLMFHLQRIFFLYKYSSIFILLKARKLMDYFFFPL